MTKPKVTVLMSVYNGEAYLKEAIDSILNQTFTDFEFIIINDGSTDNTADILKTYNDPRIQIIEQENIGLTRSLNKGLALAQGEYIARMDADDISMPERFACQVKYLDSHPKIAVVGTSGLVKNETNNTEKKMSVFTSDQDLRHNLIKGNPFIHTSIMMRTRMLKSVGGYDESFKVAQDYALWIQLARRSQLANLPDVLVIHRDHQQTISVVKRAEWHSVWLRVKLRYQTFRYLNYPFYYCFYILQPIVFVLIELQPSFIAYLKQFAQLIKSKRRNSNV